jgi:hypothetical protein
MRRLLAQLLSWLINAGKTKQQRARERELDPDNDGSSG